MPLKIRFAYGHLREWHSLPSIVNCGALATLACGRWSTIWEGCFINWVGYLLNWDLTTTHGLCPGLYSHAVKHYERVLELADKAGVCPTSSHGQFDLGIFLRTGNSRRKRLTIWPSSLPPPGLRALRKISTKDGSQYDVQRSHLSLLTKES